MAIASYVGNALDKNLNTFEDWLARTNALSADMGSSVITTGNNNTGSVEISGALTSNTVVTEAISATSNLAIGSSTDITGGLTVSGAFDVNGNAQFDGTNVNVYGTTLTITSNTIFGAAVESVDVQNKLFFGGNNYVYGTANNSIGINGDAYINGRLFLNSGLTFANTAAPWTVETDLIVNGTFTAAGFSANGTISTNADLDMGNNRIINLATPVANTDAVTKLYVDTELNNLSTELYIAGDTGSNTVVVGTDTLTFNGTMNEIVTAVGNDSVTISLPNTVSGLTTVSATNLTSSGTVNVNGTLAMDGTTLIDSTKNIINVLGLGVGTANTANNEIRATGDITAFFSDERLKNFHGRITNALNRVLGLNGYYWTPNDTAVELGIAEKDKIQVGVSAQEVNYVLPEVIKAAPISDKTEEDYMTLDYGKLVPLLIEAIKELNIKIEILENR